MQGIMRSCSNCCAGMWQNYLYQVIMVLGDFMFLACFYHLCCCRHCNDSCFYAGNNLSLILGIWNKESVNVLNGCFMILAQGYSGFTNWQKLVQKIHWEPFIQRWMLECGSIIHDHDCDIGVNIVGWLDVWDCDCSDLRCQHAINTSSL